jgi:hypothetical protein
MVEVVSPERAIAKAVEIAGSEDFGADGWREGLERSLAAFPKLPLLPEAREASIGKIIHDLSMRLRIVRWLKDNPEIEAQPIEGPVFVIGLPRTGTTATVGMMALDERFRFLRAWEGASPMPPPVAGEEDRDPRVIAARKAAAGSDHAHMHIVDPDGPEEDLAMMAGLDMRSYHGTLPMPDDYIDWWMNSDFTSFYAFEERVLKLLQSRRPPHLWLLKSPPHLLRLREILRQYPDAKIVVTHRDPVKVIGSVASLHTALHEARCVPGSVDRAQVGRRQLALWAEGMRRFLAVRDEVGEDRFIDVRNDDVVKRPIATFERIYDHLGMPLTSPLRARLEDYNSRNAPGAFGTHRYTAEEYGLTDAAIRAAFRDYGERFGLWEKVA